MHAAFLSLSTARERSPAPDGSLPGLQTPCELLGLRGGDGRAAGRGPLVIAAQGVLGRRCAGQGGGSRNDAHSPVQGVRLFPCPGIPLCHGTSASVWSQEWLAAVAEQSWAPSPYLHFAQLKVRRGQLPALQTVIKQALG